LLQWRGLTRPEATATLQGAMRGHPVLLAIIIVPIALSSWPAWAEAPLPILRGIVLIESREARAYFEDPRTGALAGYAIRDTVGDCRVEEIRVDRVLLRRGEELIPMLLGASSAVGVPSVSVTASTSETSSAQPRPAASPAVEANPAAESDPRMPTIGNGQPWLDRLGIPPGALSWAIDQALPAIQNPNNLAD